MAEIAGRRTRMNTARRAAPNAAPHRRRDTADERLRASRTTFNLRRRRHRSPAALLRRAAAETWRRFRRADGRPSVPRLRYAADPGRTPARAEAALTDAKRVAAALAFAILYGALGLLPAAAQAQDITLTWTGRKDSGGNWTPWAGRSQDYSVKLTSLPSADVTVTIGEGSPCPHSGTWTVDTDLLTSGDQNTLTFTTADWSTAQTVRLNAQTNAGSEDELCAILHSGSGGGYDGVSKTNFVISETFDGSVHGNFLAQTINGPEGRKGEYFVYLTEEPTGDVTVTITYKSGDTDISVDTDPDTPGDQNTRTLTTSNWSNRAIHKVTIRSAEDGDTERGKAVFTHTATGGGYTESIGSRVVDATLWEVDDDDPPSKPTDLSATAGDASAALSWKAATGAESLTYSKWQYRYKTTGGYGSWTDMTNSDKDTVSYTVTGLTNGTQHTFEVRAYNDVAGAASSEVTATPLAPLTFGTKTISDYSFARTRAITTLTLPEATGGLAPLAYTLAKTTGTPSLPPGLTFTSSSRQLSGSPSALQTAAGYTYTVTDSSSPANTATLTFDIAVTANSTPSLGSVTDRSFHQDSAITALVLPEATGGNTPLTYDLARTTGTPKLPPGLGFDDETRTLSGTPTGHQTATGYTYTVTDSDGDTATATFNITVTQDNEPSFGSATVADQTWFEDHPLAALTLPEATGGDSPLTYSLEKTTGTPALPLGVSFASGTRQLSGTPTATQSSAGYTYTVTDNDGDTDTLAFNIGIGANTAPTANAGADRRAALGASVTLDGSGSSDPEKQTLTYAWSHTGGSPSVSLTGADTASPSFTAPSSLSSEAALTFTLTVTDPGGSMATDTVTVTVATASTNRAPTANAGPDRSVSDKIAIALDGSRSSDPEQEALTYAWAQKTAPPVPIDPLLPPGQTPPPITPTVTLSSTTAVKPTFTAPDVSVDTPLTFTLKVTDASGNESAVDEVTITVKDNSVPVANAGPDQTVSEGATVTLDGSGSVDADTGDTLTYAWAHTGGSPTVTLTDPTTASPTFTAPSDLSANAALTFTLTVKDGVSSDTDTVTVTVTAGANTAPTANAGADQTVGDGALVTLDGSGSSDPQNQTLTYAWSQTAGTTVTLSSTSIAKPTFTAPSSLSSDATLTFSLVVTDAGGLASQADTVTVTVQANTAPTANAGADRYAAEGATVTLDGSASSDAESSTLTYAWTHSAGTPAVTLTGPNTATPSFTAPSSLTQDAALTFTLTVTDQRGLTATDDVIVTVATATNNRAPTANAGPDRSISEGLTATLDGSGSRDREGETLSYAWTQTGTPAVTLSSTTAAKPTFATPAVSADTALTFSLTVTAGGKTSTADTVTVTVKDNSAPTANAGADQNVVEGQTVTLDGSASSDPESQTLNYAWTQVGIPAVTLSSTTATSPTFTAPSVTKTTGLTFSLTVTDSLGRSSTADTVSITVENNTAPTANAGDDRNVVEGQTVTLNGSGSTDPENQTLAYAWTQTAGTTVALSSTTAASPTFTAPAVTQAETLTFSLTVTDPGGLASSADTVTITVGNNTAPTANAGDDRTVAEGASVTLDGSASTDPESQTLAYAWSQTAGTTVTLSSTTVAQPTFTAPSSLTNNESLTFSLTVTDPGGLASTADTVTITVRTAANNQAPTANAGPDRTVAGGTPVILDGSASSDPESETLAYAWTQTAGTTVTLSSTSAQQPTFTAPTPNAGQTLTLTFSLTVTAGGKTSAADTVTITVGRNSAPTANAGPDRTVAEGAAVTLDGGASSDPDNQTLTWAWSQTAGTTVTLSSTTVQQPTFTAPSSLTNNETLTFSLTVTDTGGLVSTADTVTITVRTAANNQAPTANAGADRTVAEGSTVTLDGSASSDPEGEALSYAWTQTAGTTVTLSSASVRQPTFTAPTVQTSATLTFSLTVTAGGKTSTADTVTVTVENDAAPTANAGADRRVAQGATVTLDGSASSDPHGQTLTYAWAHTGGTPAVTLTGPASAKPTFTAPTSLASDAALVFTLTVTDTGGLTATDTVTVTVPTAANNTAPTANAGADRTAAEGATVTLDGSLSSDPEGETLAYAWTQTAGTTVTLSSATVAKPTFAAPTQLAADASLTFSLTVTAGGKSSAADTVVVTVTAGTNDAPTANAGADQTVGEGTTVTLDGSASTDPEGETLTYAWSQTAGTTVTLGNTTVASPTFTAPVVTEETTLTFSLTVTDARNLASSADTVDVTVRNDAPTANAGPDQSVFSGATVTLDGSASSSPGGDTLSYAWAQLPTPPATTVANPVTMSSQAVVGPTFTAPTSTRNLTLTFGLRVTDSQGVASASDTVQVLVKGLPAAAAGLTSSYNNPGVTLTWTNPNDSSITGWEYRWRRTTDTFTNDLWEAIPNSGATTTSATVGGGAGVTLVFQVRAVNANGAGAPSNTTSELMPPLPPTGLSFTGGDRQVTLSWTDPEDSSITSWQYRLKDGNWTAVASSGATTTSATVTGLTNGLIYTYQVRAANSAGESAPSGEVAAMTVPAKRNLRATPGSGQVTLVWGGPNFSHITKFRYRQKSAGSSDYGSWTDVPGSSASTTGYTVTGLAPGTEYAFQVRAVNPGGEGVVSDEAKATPTGSAATQAPAAPTITIATGDGRVRLSWSDPDDDSVSRYDYRRKTAGTWGSATNVADSGASTTSHTVTGLTNGASYAFQVRAANSVGTSAWSNEVSTTLFSKPAGLTATPRDGGADLAWTNLNDSTVTAWQYRYRTDGGSYGAWNLMSGSGASTTSHSVAGLDNGHTYGFRIRPVKTGAAGPSSDEASATLIPAKPAGLAAKAGAARVALTWTDPNNSSITRWQFRRKEGTNAWGPWTRIDGSGASTTAQTVTGLTNGTEYRFRVRAVNATGAGTASDAVAATPQALPPAPTGLTATGGNRTVALAWTSAGGAGIKRWRFQMRAGSLGWDHDPRWFDIPGGASAATHTVTGLDNWTEYGFRVAAINHIGPGYASTEARATPRPVVPAAPTDLAGTAGDRQVVLDWTDGDDGGSPVTAWQIVRKDGANAWGTTWTDLPRSRTVTGLTNGTSYRFKVRGVNAAGSGAESAPSDPVSPAAAAPSAPTGLSAATASADSVLLTWTNPADLSIGDWQVQQAVPPSIPFGADAWYSVPGAGASTTSATVTGLRYRGVQSFRIRAVNGHGGGAASAGVQARPAAPAATLAKSVGKLAVTWTAPANLGPALSGYTVQWKSGGQSFGSSRQATTTGTSHSIGSLTDGTEYSVRVRAANAAGAGPWSTVVAATPGANPPLKPGRPRAVAGNAQVSLTWTAGGNGGSAITSWKVRRKAGTNAWGAWTAIPGSNATTTGHTATTLTNGIEYTFQVLAVNSAGDGAASDDSNPVTPSVTGPTAPAAPTNLTATPGNAQVALSWTAGDDGDSAVTMWKVRRKDGTNPWGSWTAIPDSNASTTGYTATPLTNGTAYRFQVRAANSVGDGTASAEAAATPAGPPGAPTGLKVNVESHQRLLVAWLEPADDGGADISNYWVQWKSGTQEFSTSRQLHAGAAADTDGYVKRSIFGLTNATTYTVRVQAVTSGGAGPWSSTATGTPRATVPDTPADLAATKAYERLDVSWTAPASNGSDITGYTLQWKSGTQNFDSTRQQTATGTTSSIAGLTNGTQYILRVRATNGIGNSPWSPVATGTPGRVPDAPAGLVIRSHDRHLTFGWRAPADNGSAITGYTLQWKSGTEEWDTAIRQATTTNTQHTWGLLVNGTTYTCRVRATNGNGDGPWSAEFSGIPGGIPSKPTALTAAGGDGQATLNWISGGDGDSPITKWQFRRQTGTNPWGDWTDIDDSGASTTSHTATGLDNGRQHVFQVRAVNTTGDGAASDAATATLIPAKPAGVAATPNGATVSLSWTNPEYSTITRWEYRYKTGSGNYGSWTQVPGSTASTTSAAIAVASVNRYVFQIRAVNATGNGAASDEATATRLPAQPTGVDATPGNRAARLSWDDPANDTITHWEYRIDSRDRGYSAWTRIPGSSAATTGYLVAGLDNGTIYRFQVRAVNAVDSGPASRQVSARPRNAAVRLSVHPQEVREHLTETVTVTATLVSGSLVGGPVETFSSPVTVAVKVGADTDTATSGTDYYEVGDFNLVIPANSTSRSGSFAFLGLQDTESEGREAITVSGSAPGLTVTGASLAAIDAQTNSLVFSKSAVSLTETASPTATYAVRLSTVPAGDVSVTLANPDTGAVTVSPASLTFGTVLAPQTVTLSAVADDDGNDESVAIVHTATGGGFGGVTGTVTVRVSDDDTPPTANAGEDRQAGMGATVTLDGSASTDPQSQSLTYAWSHTGGSPAVTLTGPSTARPSFTAPFGLTQNAALTFTLTVTDPGGRSSTDTVTVTVVTAANNRAPTVDAGADRTVREGTFVTLDGSGTDTEGENLTWAWTRKPAALPPLVPGEPLPPASPVAPPVALNGADTAKPTFTAPDVTGDTPITFVLTVTDGSGNSSTDEVTITVRNNNPPVANAGLNQTVAEGASVTLDGSGSNDLDRADALTYAWTQTGGSPTVALTAADTQTATFTAPSQLAANATLTFTLTVGDGLKSHTDTATVTVTAGANDAPSANAGPDRRAAEGATVTLDGSASSDPEGQMLTFAWTQSGSPAVTLSSTTAAAPTFTAPSSLASDAALTFTLTVTDPGGLTATDTVTVTVPTAANNTAPTADAGSDRTVALRATVTLDGSASSDPEGEALTYAWTQTAGQTVSLSSTTAARPAFTAPSSAATLTFSLTVTAGGKTSAADTVTIAVHGSTRPTADAGPDQTVEAGATVTLDGSASSDPENQALSYAWTQSAGTPVTLSSTTVARPTFTAPADLTDEQTLAFELAVTDAGGFRSWSDGVTITVTPRDRPPTADAGADRTAHENTRVQLDGSASSDPDGDALSYAWTRTGGPAVTLSAKDTATPRFQAPAQLAADAPLTFELTVTAGGKTATDRVTVVVKAGANDAPTADAGADQRVGEAAVVTLDGSASSDPEGETLTFAWTQTAGTTVTLSSTTVASPTFTAPTVTADATLTFSLTVTDARGLASTADTTTVTVRDGAPAANAGPDRTVAQGATVTLDGSASTDPENQTLTWAWTQTSGTTVTLSSTTVASPTFTAPSGLASDETLVFSLLVTDPGGLKSSPDTVTVTVRATAAPTADAGDDRTVSEGLTVTLDGSGSSDPTGEALSYAWTQTAGTAVTLSSPTAVQPNFTAPDVAADTALTFSLTVTDPGGTRLHRRHGDDHGAGRRGADRRRRRRPDGGRRRDRDPGRQREFRPGRPDPDLGLDPDRKPAGDALERDRGTAHLHRAGRDRRHDPDLQLDGSRPGRTRLRRRHGHGYRREQHGADRQRRRRTEGWPRAPPSLSTAAAARTPRSRRSPTPGPRPPEPR